MSHDGTLDAKFNPLWRYAGMQFDDVANGAGLGAVFFTQYCPHRCPGCQNQQTWTKDGGRPFSPSDLERLMNYYDEVPFASRLTVSGGDPLSKPDLVYYLVSEFKERFHHRIVWIYTGFTLEELFSPEIPEQERVKTKEILKLCDVLVDGPYIQNQRDITLKFRGSSNQRMIDIKRTAYSGKITLYRG